MSFAPQANDRQLSISTLGSLVTQSDPTNVPSGTSPACSDIQFVPGSISMRDGLKKVFATPFGTATVTYSKSYIDPKGVIRNLFLDSTGNLWVENLTASPGVYSLLTTVTAGSYAKSVTAFGREYIAISDKLHGSDIPLQYDGTNLDRVTQDGPGSPPNIAGLVLPTCNIAASGAGIVYNVNTAHGVIPGNQDPDTGNFYAIYAYFDGSPGTLTTGASVTLGGAVPSPFAGVWTAAGVFPNVLPSIFLVVFSAFLPSTTTGWVGFAGGTGTIATGAIQRSNNIVTVATSTPHNLRVGYQAQIAGVTPTVVGTVITKIVINNEQQQGIATVTTSSAHGLLPALSVAITGVKPVTVGTSISSITRAGQLVTVVTSAATGLAPGAIVRIAGVTDTTFVTGAVQVLNVSTTTLVGDTFTFAQADVDATSSGGTVAVNWPILDTPSPTFFDVISVPSPTTFQISVNYADTPSGGFTTGTVTFGWDGFYYVQTVIDSTTFTYQQYGPNASTGGVGTVTPHGQAAPGLHQMQVLFQTRQGYITPPSPPVSFVVNGGEYLNISNIPVGQTPVSARILAFTGARGAYFYYIPNVPQANGQIVGTATQINDNTTTAVVLDFADTTLFAAIGINTQGNNLPNQIVLDGALGFGFYASRLLTYGQRNTVQGLLNMGFDGGYLPGTPTLPTGWSGGGAGTIAAGHYGTGWTTSATALTQSFFEDYTGAPIATAGEPYTFRAWLSASGSVTATISSASTSFSSTATLTVSGWSQADFSLPMPTVIPSDMTLGITGNGVVVDEMSLIFTNTPYTDTKLNGSYVNNPEAFDGVSGVFGPSQDTHKVMDFGDIRQTLYLLTQDPSGRIHEVVNNGVTEPADWDVDEVGANCGALSAFCLTKSQADDSSASGGEEWISWASSSGARIFGGGEPWKISQEIQPDWSGAKEAGATAWSSAFGINPAAQTTVWALNDPVARVIYFGLPLGTAMAPSSIYHVNYRELDSASAIAAAAPVHIGFSGKLTAHDNARKWCPWNLLINGASLMYRQVGQLVPVFCGGNGLTPGASGFGNIYTLDPMKLTDDDYGQIHPFYVTYFMPSSEENTSLQLSGRKMLAYIKAQTSGVGTMTVTALVDKLSNPWALTCSRTLVLAPKFDLEWSGANCVGDRIALKFASSPTSGTDNDFSLTGLFIWLRTNVRIPVRGAAQ